MLTVETVAELLERFEAGLEILRKHRLHLAAVHSDQLAKEADRKQGLAAAFLVHDDLGEDVVGDVLAGLGVDDFELALLADHLGEALERDVGRAFGVIEPPVGVFLDDDDVVAGSRGRHGCSLNRGVSPSTEA